MSSWAAPERDDARRAIALWTFFAAVLLGALAIPVMIGSPVTLVEAIPTLLLGLVLSILSGIDIKTLRLPNAFTYPLGAAGLVQGWLMVPDDLVLRLLGAVLGFAMLALIAKAYRRARGADGLGLGDAKLMGAGGAWIGVQGLPSALLVASGLALSLALAAKAAGRDVGPETRIPFGPFIAVGLWILWLYGPIV